MNDDEFLNDRDCTPKGETPRTVYLLSPTDIYDFAGWLTCRPGVMPVGETSDAAPMAEAVGEYLDKFPDRFTAPNMHDKVRELEEKLARALRVVEAARGHVKRFDRPLYLTNAVEEWEAGR